MQKYSEISRANENMTRSITYFYAKQKLVKILFHLSQILHYKWDNKKMIEINKHSCERTHGKKIENHIAYTLNVGHSYRT